MEPQIGQRFLVRIDDENDHFGETYVMCGTSPMGDIWLAGNGEETGDIACAKKFGKGG